MTLAVIACGAPQQLPDRDPMTAFDAARLEATTRYLSSDALEGRAPGSQGHAAAEQHVVNAFAAAGLVPAGDRGGWLQAVPLRAAKRTAGTLSLIGRLGEVEFFRTLELRPDVDFVMFPSVLGAEITIHGTLVYAGYGISAPERGYDDLDGLDLAGKIAVVFWGAPTTIGGVRVDASERAMLADVDRKTQALAAKGAKAVLLINGKDRASRPWSTLARGANFERMEWLEGGVPRSGPVLPIAYIQDHVLGEMIGIGPARKLDDAARAGKVVRANLEATGQFHVSSKLRDLTSHNVAGIVRGSDLASETVVYTAHLDHLGIGPVIDGDAIYNGAYDDAIGIAGLVEIAHAFRTMRPGPRRSVLFLAVTAEEKGLVGSDYFVHHPTLPLAGIVANINIDALNPMYEAHDIVPIGAEHSTIWAHVESAARARGLKVSTDPAPEQTYFIRSDQYSFVQAGIPAVFPGAGYLDASGGTEINKAIAEGWGAKHYHRPSDHWLPEWRAAWAIGEAKFDFLLGVSIANATARPRWNPGDVFAKRP